MCDRIIIILKWGEGFRLQLRVLQKGFNYSQDGPGNRLVYHLQGCNLHCPWCSNPESMRFDSGEAIEIEDIVKQAVNAEMMFFDGGGVTFTGGEPTAQLEALKETLILLKENKINTAIETNGTNPKLPEIFDYTDYLIMDFKHHNSDKLKEYTGVGNETVIKNIVAACEKNKNPFLRIPLIHGFNSSKEDAEKFADILGKYKDKFSLEILRYHEYGKDKWAQNGMQYKMENAFVDDEEFEEFCNILKSNGIKLIKT